MDDLSATIVNVLRWPDLGRAVVRLTFVPGSPLSLATASSGERVSFSVFPFDLDNDVAGTCIPARRPDCRPGNPSTIDPLRCTSI